jgi:hypothetical protein
MEKRTRLKAETKREPSEMNAKLLAQRCLVALATMMIVARVATAAEQPTASGSQPQAAARTEEPGDQVDPRATQILRRACTVLADSHAFTFQRR